MIRKVSRKKFRIGITGKGGRNNLGRITNGERGGGHKRKYRVIDFKRVIEGTIGRVIGEDYDPNRNCRLAIVKYATGYISYIIKPEGIKEGNEVRVEKGSKVSKYRLGDHVLFSRIKKGLFIHNMEIHKGRGGQLMRAGGVGGHIVRQLGGNALVKLCSGIMRIGKGGCKTSIGKVELRKEEKRRKAGRKRWLGKRPKVRGVAMNPVDHPHGGDTSGGRCSVNSKGKYTKCSGNKKKRKR
jgi:large subunit ribosomal protein L2